jgi:hypothetical protein
MAINYTAAGDACNMPMNYIPDVGGKVYSFDGRIFVYDFLPMEKPYLTYLSNTTTFSDELYQSIHVKGSTKVPVFESASSRVSTAYAYEAMTDFTHYWDSIIDNKIPTLIYAG